MKQDKNRSIDTPLKNRLDWVTTIIPFVTILALCSLFMIFPDASSQVLGSARFFLGDQFGGYYLLLGLGALICSLYMAFSRYGKIKLGNLEKPQYSSFQWGSMMFTAGLAADILFYSLCEWMLYAGEPHITDMGAMQDWASTYPLFHWGPIPWSFYIILAVSFGFMLHVRKRNKQKYSEACRPLLGRRVDGVLGKLIDLTAVFALLAGTATTFSLATPLLSMALSRVLGIPENNFLTIGILVIICVVYTMAVYFGMQGIAKLAASCVYLFFGLLAYFLLCGGETRYIIETGITAVGNMVQNFVDRCHAHLLLSPKLDHLLLGLLDGMVCCHPLLHRHHQQGKDHPPDCAGRLFLRSLRHLYILHHPGQLRTWTADARKAGPDGCLCKNRRSVPGHHIHI